MATVPPEKDADLDGWSDNFSVRINSTPTLFDLTAAQATLYASDRLAFHTALAVAQNPTTRTKSNIALKNAAKATLLVMSHQLLTQVGACATLTPSQRVDLRMNPARPAHPGRLPAPVTRPIATLDNLGRVLLADETTPLSRKKPHGVDGAFLFTAILAPGAPAPAGPNEGTLFAALATASTHHLAIPPGNAGKILWLFAQWCNPTGTPGPVSAPSSVMIAA